MIRLLFDECMSPRLVGIALDAIEAARFDTINQLIEVDEAGTVTMSAWPFPGNAA